MKFKRSAAVIAALCIALPSATGALNAAGTPPLNSNNIVAGDVNIDYVFNLSDIVLFSAG